MAKKRSRGVAVQLEASYRELFPLVTRLGEELEHQLDQLIGAAQIALSFPIQRRVKSWDSIAEKLERKSLSLGTLRELNDLVGLRIILQFRRDVDRVSQLIDSTFDVIERYDTVDRLREDQFGYSSTHFVVRVPDGWLAVPTMTAMKGLRAELQVRTTAQHIWAAASHVLQYKQEASVPGPIRRSIHRVSALLETVDLEFERVLDERETYRAQVTPDDTADKLNVDLLAKLLDAMLPAANKREPEQYGDLLEDLAHFSVTTPTRLKEILEKHLSSVLAEEAALLKANKEGQQTLATTAERIKRGVFYAHAGLTRQSMKREFGAPWSKYLNTVRITRAQAGT